MGNSAISMVIFSSYVNLPEGTYQPTNLAKDRNLLVTIPSVVNVHRLVQDISVQAGDPSSHHAVLFSPVYSIV